MQTEDRQGEKKNPAAGFRDWNKDFEFEQRKKKKKK